MYEVFLERAARKDLEVLPARVFRQVIACVRGLALDPRPPGARKIVGSDNAWRVRLGDYRVVYEVDDAAFRVIVYRVRHRKEAYLGL